MTVCIPEVSISSITFQCGTKIDIKKNDIVVFVGSNNAGKSQSLRDIKFLFENTMITDNEISKKALVVKELEKASSATKQTMLDYLESNFPINLNQYQIAGDYSIAAFQVSQIAEIFGPFSRLYLRLIDSSTRLSTVQPTQAPPFGQLPSSPMQALYQAESLLSKLSDLFEAAFGLGIVNNFKAGGEIVLHTVKDEYQGSGDRVSDSYQAWLATQPKLCDQGDGMKSYAGILINTVIDSKHVVLIDEPEAFLHTPQQKRLGSVISSEAAGQLFIATHSTDVLQGLTEESKVRVRIIRLVRKEDETEVFEASPEDVSSLFEEPILKYSKAFDAVFHEQSVICEDDSDCRLYNATYDFLAKESTARAPDTLFIPSGGKGNIHRIVSSLKKVGVTSFVICDIDILNNWKTFERIVKLLDGDADSLVTYWKVVKAQVTTNKPVMSPDEIKNAITSSINSSAPSFLPKSEIENLLKATSPWWALKNYGHNMLKGDGRVAFDAICDYCDSIGLIIIREGEIEKLVPQISGHGPAFVNSVLTELNFEDDKLNALRKLVSKLLPSESS